MAQGLQVIVEETCGRLVSCRARWTPLPTNWTIRFCSGDDPVLNSLSAAYFAACMDNCFSPQRVLLSEIVEFIMHIIMCAVMERA